MRRFRSLADVPVTSIEGRRFDPPKPIGAARAAGLEAAFGITSVLDLLLTYPARIHDRTREARIKQLRDGQEAWIQGRVVRASSNRTRAGRMRFEYRLSDGSGFLSVNFFNPRHIRMKEGREYILFGSVKAFRGGLSMAHPEIYPVTGDDAVDARRVPIYRQSEKHEIGSNDLELWIQEALDRAGALLDPVPPGVLAAEGLLDRTAAMRLIHQPIEEHDWQRARRRLVFDELLRIQLALLLRKQAIEQRSNGIRHDLGGELVARFVERLPFELTDAQRAAITDIQRDLAGPHPMHRLLQGDVGSGKTVVAVAAMLTGVQGGHQAVLMAPTEVLAEQHASGIRRLVEGLEVAVDAEAGLLFDRRELVVALLTNRTTAKERERLVTGLAEGTIDIVIGTHALLEEGIAFRSLGVVVIDEQHRFGVEQRSALRAKGAGDTVPDVLVMTATPIPRTAAMTVYGDLDLTEMRGKPVGRLPITTAWEKVAPHEGQLDLAELAVWAHVREQVAAGRQAYVVCPLIEESEKLEVRSATETHAELEAGPLAGLRLGLLHGRLKAAEKEATMEAFRAGRVDVLVATTVIEVGVDVPNATVMVILDADRFGIAQLHQLRGRVGRGSDQSWCYLVAAGASPDAERRLLALCDPEHGLDGFRLAEVDLEVRGEGTVFDVQQKGRNDLRLASLLRDRDVVDRAREVAAALVEADPGLDDHPELLDDVRLFHDDEVAEFLAKS